VAQHALGNVRPASTTTALPATNNLTNPAKNFGVQAPGTSPVTRPGWTIGDPTKPAAFDAATFWILPAVSGEGVRVTAVR